MGHKIAPTQWYFVWLAASCGSLITASATEGSERVTEVGGLNLPYYAGAGMPGANAAVTIGPGSRHRQQRRRVGSARCARLTSGDPLPRIVSRFGQWRSA
jgi:hypothetical protein